MNMRSKSAGGLLSDLCRGGVVLLVCCIWLAGCDKPALPEQSATAVTPTAAETDFALFDRLVTAESVFPDPVQRGLYRMLPPVTESGQRTYTFHLNPQPGMDKERHFNLVTITWARGGQLVKTPGSVVAPSGVGGPGGGFIDAFAQTNDRAYDVRVSQGMLLPNSVNVPAFDVEKAAANMIRLYSAQRTDK